MSRGGDGGVGGGEGWDEREAVRLMREAGDRVAWLGAGRAGIEDPEGHRARIVAAYEARDADGYREALDAYVAAAREAEARHQQAVAEARARERSERAARKEASARRRRLERAGWEAERDEAGKLMWRNPQSGSAYAEDAAYALAFGASSEP